MAVGLIFYDAYFWYLDDLERPPQPTHSSVFAAITSCLSVTTSPIFKVVCVCELFLFLNLNLNHE